MAINNKFITKGLFCDLEKAFDSMYHEISSKLEFHGVTRKVKLWLIILQ